MIDCRFVPIAEWPGEKTKVGRRERSRFMAKYSDTLDLLEKELRNLRAKEILIQAYFAREHIRNDGWPKSNAPRPSDPGVILTFHDKAGKVISMPCDRFSDWESNLRAIALSLTALRTVDRYGVTRNGEQYRGWQQLDRPAQDGKMSVEQAADILARESGFNAANIKFYRDTFMQCFPAAVKAAHPDKGGTSQRFDAVMRARAVLNSLHGCAV